MAYYSIQNFTHYNTQAIEQLLQAVEDVIHKQKKEVVPAPTRSYSKIRVTARVLHIHYTTLDSGEDRVSDVGYQAVKKSIGIVRPHALYSTEVEALAALAQPEAVVPEDVLVQLGMAMSHLYGKRPVFSFSRTGQDLLLQRTRRLVSKLLKAGFKVRVESKLETVVLKALEDTARTKQRVQKALRRAQWTVQSLERGFSSMDISIRALEGLEPNLNKEQKKILEKLKDIKFQHEELLKLTTKIE